MLTNTFFLCLMPLAGLKHWREWETTSDSIALYKLGGFLLEPLELKGRKCDTCQNPTTPKATSSPPLETRRTDTFVQKVTRKRQRQQCEKKNLIGKSVLEIDKWKLLFRIARAE